MNGKGKEAKKAPVNRVKYFPVEVSVWENETKVKGELRKWLSFSVQRTYKDEKEEWQNTASMRRQDLLPLAKALEKAFDETADYGKPEEGS